MINYRFKINFQDEKVLTSDICFVSGDVGAYKLSFDFFDNGKKVDISNYTLSIRAKRSDGVVVSGAGGIKDNTATFIPENNFFAVPGEVYMEIALSDSAGRYATTKIIIASVVQGLGEAAVEGSDNLSVYVTLLNDVQRKIDEANKLIEESVPQKGVDYWTDEDRTAIEDEVAANVSPKIYDGEWWVYDSTTKSMAPSGIKAEGLDGEQGIQGEKGDTGADGYSPVKGVDYYTEEEKTEFLNEVLQEPRSRCANALKGNASNEIVSITDVSPVEHNLGVEVSSKNLIPYPYAMSTTSINGVTFTDNGDGTITANGTATKNTEFRIYTGANLILPNTQYILSGCVVEGTSKYQLRVSDGKTKAYACTKETGEVFSYEDVSTFSVSIYVQQGEILDNVVFKPQLEKGTMATTYTPYVDVSTVTLLAQGKNLLRIPNSVQPYTQTLTQTMENGIVSLKGTLILSGDSHRAYNPLTGRTLANYVKGVTMSLAGGAFRLPRGIYTFSESQNDFSYLLVGKLGVTVWDGKVKVYSANSTFEVIDDETYGLYLWELDVPSLGQEHSIEYTVSYPQLECSPDVTAYEPSIDPTNYLVAPDGTVEGVKSIYPSMTLLTDKQSVVIDCEYNRDINKAFAELQNAIISLGGNV